MSLARRTVLSINLNEDGVAEQLKSTKTMSFLKESEIHLVYIFQSTSMSFGLGEIPAVYPTKSHEEAIRQSTNLLLQDLVKNNMGQEFQGKVHTHCLFSENPKLQLCEFVKERNIDLVVMWARRKRGFFDSSFSHYVSKHTDANVMVIKHK